MAKLKCSPIHWIWQAYWAPITKSARMLDSEAANVVFMDREELAEGVDLLVEMTAVVTE